jgi:hypothetical protein
VDNGDAAWDVFEAPRGVSFTDLIADGKTIPWSRLRHWLYDLAVEMWAATGDKTLPAELSLDHVWITTQGQAVLLDEPWPAETPAERIDITDFAGQQRFLSVVAAYVESTNLPLHARGVLQNLAAGKFEKLSFLTGILRGLQDKPADVSKGIRAGSLFMLPGYICIMTFVGYYQGDVQARHPAVLPALLFCTMVVLGIIALVQLAELSLLRTNASHSIFRLAVVDVKGRRAGRVTLLKRWAIVWLPLFVPMLFVVLLIQRAEYTAAFVSALVMFMVWIGAAVYAVIVPNRGLHDRLAGTWVVRR